MELISWDRAGYAKDNNKLQLAMERAAELGISQLLVHLKSFDFPFKEYLEAADKVGIKVHTWIKPTFSAKDIVKRTLSAENLQRQKEQFNTDFARACLNNPSNLEQGLQGINTLIKKFGDRIAGIHLDYVRNDNAVFIKDYPCECNVCKNYRKKWLGHEILTKEDLQNPAIMYKELLFRNRNITDFVRKVRDVVNKTNLKLSMAARANYLNLPDIEDPPVYGLGPAVYEGQDWLAWAEEGILDFICTMNYHTQPKIFTEMLNSHLRLLQDTGVDFYTGIGIESSMGSLAPKEAAFLLDKVKDTAAKGCSLFHFESLSLDYKEALTL